MTGTTPGCVPAGDLAPAAGLLDISSEDMCEAQLGEEAKERAWTTPGVPRLHSGNRLPSPKSITVYRCHVEQPLASTGDKRTTV